MATIDHVTEALTRFQQSLKDQPNLAAFLTATVAPMQDIEAAMQQLLTERTVDTAVGAQLDDLGVIVGQPRDGLLDDTYRRYIRARIMSNRSRGIVEDLIRIARLVVDNDAATMTVSQPGIAAVVLRVDGITVSADTATALISFLRAAKSGGVRIIMESTTGTYANAFRLDTGPGLDVGQFVDAYE